MTVQGQTPAVADADRQAAERQFTEIYNLHARRLQQHIYFRLPLRLAHLADDFAQETWLAFWQYLTKGRSVDKPFGLLRVMANSQISDYFRLHSTSEAATDFEDPETPAPTPSGHRYAATDPELVIISRELDGAMERMRQASEKWRGLHQKAHYSNKRQGAGPELMQIRADRDAALKVLQAACGQVGQLRADLERAGGQWKSSSGWGPGFNNGEAKSRQGSVASDLSVTHCPKGHLLELDNVLFMADGTRRCAACNEASRANRSNWNSSKRKTNRRGGPSLRAAVEAAGKALVDPANAHKSVAQIAREYDVHPNTLARNFPDITKNRRKTLAGAAR